MYIVIAGGGKLGYFLTKDLLEKKHEVTLIEKDKAKASKLANVFGEVAMEGDACDPKVMENAGVGRADVLVAVTGHDEDNFIICHVAKTMYPSVRAVARINNPKNETIFRKVKVDVVVNGVVTLTNVIEHELNPTDLFPLLALRRGGMEIVEVIVRETSHAAGKQVRELEFPSRSVLVSVLRDDELLVPRGDLQLCSGDLVIALVDIASEELLRRAFNGGTDK